MILRRVIEHVKAQNWFAVGLDFAIVVIGVYIGMQVNNWNQHRADRALDALYIDRLHDEVIAASDAINAIRRELHTTLDQLSVAVKTISRENQNNTLTQYECDAVFSSHIYLPGRKYLPTLQELISSGRASLLSNVQLRSAILKLQQQLVATEAQAEYINLDSVVIARRYPEMVQLGTDINFDRYGFAILGGQKCQLDKMRASLAFKNDLFDNYFRMDGYVRWSLDPEQKILDDVHTLIDQSLGIGHEAETR